MLELGSWSFLPAFSRRRMARHAIRKFAAQLPLTILLGSIKSPRHYPVRNPSVNFTRTALFLGLLAAAAGARADPLVKVSSTADPAYSFQKYAGARPRTETYVVMPGRYFDGPSVDHS